MSVRLSGFELSISLADIRRCNRLRGGSITDCGCRLGDGWLACPRAARGVLPAEMIETCRAVVLPGAALAPPTGGFTGEACDQCGSFQVIRTGTCSCCAECGTSVGGCS